MTSWFITMIYVGGFKPAYDHYRAEGDGKFMAVLNSLTWPIDFGH